MQTHAGGGVTLSNNGCLTLDVHLQGHFHNMNT